MSSVELSVHNVESVRYHDRALKLDDGRVFHVRSIIIKQKDGVETEVSLFADDIQNIRMKRGLL